MKETAEIRIPSITANDYEKDGAEFLNSIKITLNRQINDRLTQILDNSDELIIKKSQLSREESFVEKDYYQVIYSETIEHSPLIRCKDCRHWKRYVGYDNGKCKISDRCPTEDWYCADGKRKETKE